MHKPIDRTGRTHGRLTVLSRDQNRPDGRTQWLCRCECGTEKVVTGKSLDRGKTMSCGCLQREGRQGIGSLRRSHGRSGTPEYIAWIEMLKRCTRPELHSWDDYGGRGITVHPRWRDFGAFLADMGQRPSRHHSLDRIDNNGNYEPGNCRWATRTEQSRNKRNNLRITIGCVTATLADWADISGVRAQTIRNRVLAGWQGARILSKTDGRFVQRAMSGSA